MIGADATAPEPRTEVRGLQPRNDVWRPGEFALRDAWFPVAHGSQVGPRPVRRMVHSQPFYIWREGESLRATEFHPDVLEAGRKHATHFSGGTGNYPVVELYGHAWVWYGDPDNADLDLVPDIPFLPRRRPQPGYANQTQFFHCTYELVIENILDLTHIDYVHGNFAGPPESESDKVTCESTSETVTMIRTIKKRKTSDYQREVLNIREPYQDQQVFTHVFIRSGVCFLHSHYSAAPSMPLMQTNTPESRVLTRANVALGVQQCDDALFRRAWPRTTPAITAQDESMLNPQNPRYIHSPEGIDCSTRFDAAGILYRRRHTDLIKRQKAGDCSYESDVADGSDIARILKVKRID